jgi:hypothetical protein
LLVYFGGNASHLAKARQISKVHRMGRIWSGVTKSNRRCVCSRFVASDKDDSRAHV